MRISDWSSDVCSSDLVAAAMCWTAPAVAQERQRYAIPSGDAVAAVQRLAVQSGVQVMVPQSDLKGITTNDINCNYTPVEALRPMLAGKGLEVGQNRDGGGGVRCPSRPIFPPPCGGHRGEIFFQGPRPQRERAAQPT